MAFYKNAYIDVNILETKAPSSHITRCRFVLFASDLLKTIFSNIGVNLSELYCLDLVSVSQHVPKYLLSASKPAVATDEVAAPHHDTSSASVSKLVSQYSSPQSVHTLISNMCFVFSQS